jgi:RecA-family ATPase
MMRGNATGHDAGNGHAGPRAQPPYNDHDTSGQPPRNGHDTVAPLHDDGAEKCVLGALLIANTAYPKIASFLRAEHFGIRVHADIYAAIGDLLERSELANPVTLGHYFEDDQGLKDVGGAQYLVHLAEAASMAGATACTVGDAEAYARRVVDMWLGRAAICATADLSAAIGDPKPGVATSDHIARLHTRLEEIILDAPELQPISPANWAWRPVQQREWVIADWIPLRRATGLYGAPGAGKSLLMQILCTAAALDGQSWLGLPVRKCRSVLFYCEDDEDEMHWRQEQINRPYGCTYDDLRDMLCLPLLGRDGTLMTFDRDGRGVVTPLLYKLRSIIKQHRAQLVILDTLSDVFGGNELNRSHARQFVQQVAARLARDCNCAVICCAHPSLSGISSGRGGSGTTGWEGAFRSHLYLHPLDLETDEIADPDGRMLTRKKSNWASAGERIEMRWSDGVFIHKPQPTGILGSIGRSHAERVFLTLLDERCKERRWVSANEPARNYAPREFGKYPKDHREGFRAKDFREAMDRLLRGPKPAIVIEEYGRPSAPHTRLVRASDAA